MSNWYNNLDNLIQRQFQSVTETLQVKFDKNCFWFAYIFSNITGIFCLVMFGYMFRDGYDGAVQIFLSLLLLLQAMAELTGLPYLKRLSQSNLPRPPTGDLAIRKLVRPLFVLVFAVLILPGEWLLATLSFSMACKFYLEQCIPLPPEKLKERKPKTALATQT